MSRRKQSHPKHLNRKTDDELEEVAKAHSLPTDLLQLREQTDHASVSESPGSEYAVISTIPLPQGSNFGPFRARQVDPELDRQDYGCVLEFPTSSVREAGVSVAIESETGNWLKLLKQSSDEDSSNILISLQDSQTVWCQTSRDIASDTELVAMLTTVPDAAASPAAEPPSPATQEMMTLTEQQQRQQQQQQDDGQGSPTEGRSIKVEVPSPEVITPMMHQSPPEEAPSRGRKRKLSDTSTDSTVSSSPSYPLIHCCPFCEVKFSSPNTLQAHVAIYCSKKPASLEALARASFTESKRSEAGSHQAAAAAAAAAASGKKEAENPRHTPSDLPGNRSRLRRPSSDRHSVGGASITSDDSSGVQADLTESPAAKAAKTGQVFHCPQCAYISEKRVGLMRHMRVHGVYTSKEENRSRSRSASPSEERVPLSEMFCRECNIQFSSVSTFRGHKELYCELRRRNVTGSREPRSRNTSPSSARSPGSVPEVKQRAAMSGCAAAAAAAATAAASQAAIALPHGATVLPPGANMLMPQSQTAMILGSPMMMTTNDLRTMAFNVPVVVQPLIPPMSNNIQAHQPSAAASVAPSTQSNGGAVSEKPLDLSIRKESPPAKIKKEESKTNGREETADVNQPEDLSLKKTPASTPGMASPPNNRQLQVANGSQPPRPIEIVPMVPIADPASVSRCLECNIVFYKYENFLAHKQHYCTGQRIDAGQSEGVSASSPEIPVASRSLNSSPGSSSDVGIAVARAKSSPATSPSAAPAKPASITPEFISVDQTFLQYYCFSCKIKFSSLDTLTAHKQFYCPAREQPPVGPPSQQDAAAKATLFEDAGLEAAADGNNGFMCPQCRNAYPSARLLKLHFCTGSSMHIPLFRCPYCEYIAQTDNRLVEHIKAHAPSKAYKCMICGYRGNTVRGMRMHGKTHIDAGEGFTDDSMIEYEEPPAIPKKFKSHDSADIDIETELLRIKNEPYKRRRSRKSFEKSEHFTYRRQAPHQCIECNASFMDTSQLRTHMRTHLEEKTYSCKSCDFVCSHKASLVRHVKLVHETTGTTTASQVAASVSHRSSLDSDCSSQSTITTIKRETTTPDNKQSDTEDVKEPSSTNLDEEEDDSLNDSTSDSTNDSHSNNNNTSNHGNNQQQHLKDIKQETVVALGDKQVTCNGFIQATIDREFSCKNEPIEPEKDGELQGTGADSQNCKSPVDVEPAQGRKEKEPEFVDPVSPSSSPSSPPRLEAPPSVSPVLAAGGVLIKQETSHSPPVAACSSSPPSLSPPQPLPPSNSHLILKVAPLTKSDVDVATEGVSSLQAAILERKSDKSSVMYCKQCDITFMYLNTFIAHKKYYCNSHAGERRAALTEV